MASHSSFLSCALSLCSLLFASFLARSLPPDDCSSDDSSDDEDPEEQPASEGSRLWFGAPLKRAPLPPTGRRVRAGEWRADLLARSSNDQLQSAQLASVCHVLFVNPSSCSTVQSGYCLAAYGQMLLPTSSRQLTRHSACKMIGTTARDISLDRLHLETCRIIESIFFPEKFGSQEKVKE